MEGTGRSRSGAASGGSPDVKEKKNKKKKKKKKNPSFSQLIFLQRNPSPSRHFFLQKMNLCFSHAPFPGPTVSEALSAASRAAGDAYSRRVLVPRGDEGGGGGGLGSGGAEKEALLSLLRLLPSSSSSSSTSSTSPSSLPSLPASECSALPPTNSLTLLRGLNLKEDEKECDYGRVVAVPLPPSPPSPPPSSASSSSSSSCSCALPRPSLLDMASDEGAITILEAEIRIEKGEKVRPRRGERGEKGRRFFRFLFSLSPLSASTTTKKKPKKQPLRCPAFDTRGLASRLRPKALPSAPSEELTRETKLDLGLPTAFALQKKKSEREEEEEESDDDDDDCSFVDLALLPSPPPPAPPSAHQEENDDDEIDDEEGAPVEVRFLEEAVLGEEAKKKKRSNFLDGGNATIPELLPLLPAVPAPAEARDEPSFASIARAAIFWTKPLPPRPKPALVDVAAVEYDGPESGAALFSSSSAAAAAVVLLSLEAPALAPLGAAASRERLRRRALGGVVEPVLASLLAPAMPLEGEEEHQGRAFPLLLPPGAPTLAELATEELRRGPGAALLLPPPPPSPAPGEAAGKQQQKQRLEQSLRVSALLGALRPSRTPLA